MLADEASFNTCIDSMSAPLSELRFSAVATPSMTKSGSLLLTVLMPRTLMVVPPPPGAASVTIFTPESLPCMELSMFGSPALIGSFMSMTDTAPVRSALRCTW